MPSLKPKKNGFDPFERGEYFKERGGGACSKNR